LSQLEVPSYSRPPIARLWHAVPIADGTVSFGRAGDLAFVAVLVLAIPWLAAGVLPLVAPSARRIDPHDYWLMPTVHQLVSLLLTLIVMRLVSTRSWADWGFNLKRPGTSLALALAFGLVTTPALYLLMDQQPAPTHPIAGAEIGAVLFTHFLVIGFTQEVLFRGFSMTMLKAKWPIGAGVWAAAIFTAAHVKFAPPYIWPAQLAFAFVFGLLYALMFQRTNSLLGPSIAHGFSNTVYVAMMLLKHAFE
jgi:membrane protease YdiL (CAAX protease family)